MPVKNVRLDQIDVSSRFRALDLTKVESLKQSIKDVGLLNPITVYPGREEGRYQLAAGAHRLQALDELGWETVSVHFVEGDEDHRRLAEIDENLIRAELTPAEMAYTEAKRRELWRKIRKAAGKSTHMLRPADIMPAKQDLRPTLGLTAGASSAPANTDPDPVPPVIGDPDDPDIIDNGNDPRVGFALETARLTGQSKRDVNRNIRRGRILGKEALEKIKGTSLDSGVQLDALVDMPEAERNAAIEKAVHGYLVSVVERPVGYATSAVKKAVRAMDKCARILDSASFAEVLAEVDIETHERLPALARKLAEVLEQKKTPAE